MLAGRRFFCRGASRSNWRRAIRRFISCSACAMRRIASPSARIGPSARRSLRKIRSTRSPASARRASAPCSTPSARPRRWRGRLWPISKRRRAFPPPWRNWCSIIFTTRHEPAGGNWSIDADARKGFLRAMTESSARARARIFNLPNILTFGRVLIVPLVVACLFWPDEYPLRWTALGLFTLAAVTDFFDGYLARVWEQQSDLGRMLDPIADKLLVSAV